VIGLTPARYLGLKFQINGETHYGWARLNVQVNTTKLTIYSRLTGYAYETTPNTPIAAGQTHSASEIGTLASPQVTGHHSPVASGYASETPALASLGLLAQGSQGLAAWRREKVEVQTEALPLFQDRFGITPVVLGGKAT
jgi:hypothetical protein